MIPSYATPPSSSSPLDDLINEAMLTIDASRIHALQAANQRLDEALVILNDALNDHFR